MKTEFHLPLILFWAAIIAVPSLCVAQEPNPKIWEPLGYKSYYNKKIITKTPDIRLVWTYKPVTDESKGKRIEEVKKYDLEKSIQYQSYHHETVLWNIDCKNKLILMEEYIDFDKNGKVLDRYRYNQREWERIIPYSTGEGLYRNVCLPREKPSKKKKQ